MKVRIAVVAIGLWLAACTVSTDPPAFPLTDTLTDGRLRVSVDTLIGARISSFRIGGTEVLNTTRDAANFRWGSTVWLSPQRAWGWPPPPTFDRAPYRLVRSGERELLLTSAVDAATQLQLTKRLALRDDALYLTFTLHNRGDTTRTYGLWSNTRLPYAGRLDFVPGDSVRIEMSSDPVEATATSSRIYFNSQHSTNGKVFSDLRRGRVDYYGGNQTRFSQTTDYLRYADVAPGQAPLEVYLAPEDGFAEFEMQGPYGPILPGDSLVFELKWTGETD